MLSRTADHLYWMSRYVERAENLARMLDSHYRLSLLPRESESLALGWTAALTSLGLIDAYHALHERVEPRTAQHFLAFDRSHPGSILSCLNVARENARAVRGTITSELWETLNATYLESRDFGAQSGFIDIANFIEWVKYRSQLARGVIVSTMLRDEAYHFAAIGTFIERADATTRLLEARWRDLGSVSEPLNSEPLEWAVLLRALSSFAIYRKVYREAVTPWRVTELLLLNVDLPRSVHHAMSDLLHNLRAVRNARSAETERLAGELHARFRYGRLEELCVGGVPQFLDQVQTRLNSLADRIDADFLVSGYAG